MAQFLRDERITDLTIDKDALTQINSAFNNRYQTLNILQNQHEKNSL